MKRTRSIKTTQLALPVILIALLALTSIHASGLKHDIPGDPLASQIRIQGYHKDILPNNVIRFTHDDKLVYIKPNKGIFRSEHHPMTCWKGSGFQFQNEHLIHIGETTVYAAKLVSDGQDLHTAWWYDNGMNKVTGQLDWRWKMLRGAPAYRLINITCDNFEDLIFETNRLLQQQVIPSN